MINGLVYDFESIKLMLPTGLTLCAESVECNDKKSDAVVTGSNGVPLGIGRGEYKGTCKLELQWLEYDKLNLYAATSGGFYNMPLIPVIASYGNSGQAPVTDILLVHFTNSCYASRPLSPRLLTRQYIFRHLRHKLWLDQENIA